MRRLFAIGIVSLALGCDAAGGEPPRFSSTVAPGEELRYKVKWNFLRLGTVTLRVFLDSSCSGGAYFKTTFLVESNPDLGVLAIRDYNESLVDGSTLRCQQYTGKQWNGDSYKEMSYRFHPSEGQVVCSSRSTASATVTRVDTVTAPEGFVEGPSLLMVARCLSRSRGRYSVPTLVGGGLGTTELVFDNECEEVELDALETPVRARRYTGTTHWSGDAVAGLGGEFTGWVSDDEAAVILRAEMKILVGSIRVELEEWTRPGWVPPTGLDLITKR
jgi:hypothetical protein